MRAPEETDVDASLGIGGQATGGSASSGVGGMGGASGSGGRGGSPPPTGGTAGGTFSTGGAPGTGGSLGGAGGIGSGGTGGGAGTNGTGGSAGAGGATGAGGAAGAAGTNGAAGAMGGAGMAGGGQAGAAGAAGGKGGGTGGASASGGASGTGGAAGAAGAGGHAGAAGSGGASGSGGNTCPAGGVLDCSSSGALKLSGGQITDFSSAQWGSGASQFCDPGGLRGHVFSYSAASPSAATATVDTTAQNLKLDLTVGALGYAGGGLSFESCVNASAFTSIQFTASVTSGSLAGCVWQVQLQTQDQRDATATDPTGGTCSSNCYRYPAVPNLATPATGGSAYSETFTLFNNPASSTIATPTQVTGIQWQVNSGSSGTGTCTVELRIAGVSFH